MLRGAIIEQVLFSAAYPQVVRIMNHEGAIDSPRVRFVIERFANPLRPGVEALLSRLVDAGRIRDVPYATLHYLAVAGGGALYANPVEAALLGAPRAPRHRHRPRPRRDRRRRAHRGHLRYTATATATGPVGAFR